LGDGPTNLNAAATSPMRAEDPILFQKPRQMLSNNKAHAANQIDAPPTPKSASRSLPNNSATPQAEPSIRTHIIFFVVINAASNSPGPKHVR